MNVDKIMDFITRPKVMLWGGVLIAVIYLLVACIGSFVTICNTGRSQELAMTAHWKTMMAHYGQFRIGIVDKLNIVREKRNAINKILVDAATGRYDKPGQTGVVDRKAVFSAIQEAYPNLNSLNSFDELLKDIQAGREAFAQDQKQMSDMVRSYNDWRETGSFTHPLAVRLVGWFVGGFPSDLLQAQIGDKTYQGQKALEKMSQVMVGKDTQEIFATGADKTLETK